ncbi:hypothetical protein NDU88_002280 [Pleurodeles waltl]|uniref:Uncharacterized protein n=1 Tax=Pleurodeles waltl TaxID=8319 RepID=A0AAV7R9N3_PLEWA|nr:hypothetical protein NDU88_002280 [Pleurodeles waltl]
MHRDLCVCPSCTRGSEGAYHTGDEGRTLSEPHRQPHTPHREGDACFACQAAAGKIKNNSTKNIEDGSGALSQHCRCPRSRYGHSRGSGKTQGGPQCRHSVVFLQSGRSSVPWLRSKRPGLAERPRRVSVTMPAGARAARVTTLASSRFSSPRDQEGK